MYVYVYISIYIRICVYDVSIFYQIIRRLGEETTIIDGAGHILNGMCDHHCLISIHKNCAPETHPSSYERLSHLTWAMMMPLDYLTWTMLF